VNFSLWKRQADAQIPIAGTDAAPPIAAVFVTPRSTRERLSLEIGRAVSLGTSGIAAAVFLASVVHFL